MTEHFAVEVAEEQAGMRLDAVLTGAVPGHSRTELAALVKDGLVMVDGAAVRKPSWRLAAGARIELTIPPPPPCTVEPEEIPLSVLFEDDSIVVVDKPAGMVVHPAHGHDGGTLVNALMGGPLAPAPDDEPRKPGIVHRLDKDTSGCIVVARTAAARTSHELQFKRRKVGKVYLAVVYGTPPLEGEIDEPIGRDPHERKRMAVRETGGRKALSRFRVLERFLGASLVEVEIKTGRTHQIRVHMQSIGHPVVGDRLYAGRRARGKGLLAEFPRQALHAAQLRLRHPCSGEDLVFRAPLPIDMEDLLAALRERRGTAGHM